jgi:hypothetical protein
MECLSNGKMEMRTFFRSGSSINKPPFFKGGLGGFCTGLLSEPGLHPVPLSFSLALNLFLDFS